MTLDDLAARLEDERTRSEQHRARYAELANGPDWINGGPTDPQRHHYAVIHACYSGQVGAYEYMLRVIREAAA